THSQGGARFVRSHLASNINDVRLDDTELSQSASFDRYTLDVPSATQRTHPRGAVMQVKNRTTEAVEDIQRGLERLEALAKTDAKRLTRSYAIGKWNGLELFAHLADADLVYYYRFLKVIAEEGVPVV